MDTPVENTENYTDVSNEALPRQVHLLAMARSAELRNKAGPTYNQEKLYPSFLIREPPRLTRRERDEYDRINTMLALKRKEAAELIIDSWSRQSLADIRARQIMMEENEAAKKEKLAQAAQAKKLKDTTAIIEKYRQKREQEKMTNLRMKNAMNRDAEVTAEVCKYYDDLRKAEAERLERNRITQEKAHKEWDEAEQFIRTEKKRIKDFWAAEREKSQKIKMEEEIQIKEAERVWLMQSARKWQK